MDRASWVCNPTACPVSSRHSAKDLLMGDHGSGSMLGAVDDSSLASLMAEVDEPALQRKVLRLAVAAARADRHLADGKPWSWRRLAAIGPG